MMAGTWHSTDAVLSCRNLPARTVTEEYGMGMFPDCVGGSGSHCPTDRYRRNIPLERSAAWKFQAHTAWHIAHTPWVPSALR